MRMIWAEILRGCKLLILPCVLLEMERCPCAALASRCPALSVFQGVASRAWGTRWKSAALNKTAHITYPICVRYGEAIILLRQTVLSDKSQRLQSGDSISWPCEEYDALYL